MLTMFGKAVTRQTVFRKVLIRFVGLQSAATKLTVVGKAVTRITVFGKFVIRVIG